MLIELEHKADLFLRHRVRYSRDGGHDGDGGVGVVVANSSSDLIVKGSNLSLLCNSPRSRSCEFESSHTRFRLLNAYE